MFFRMTGLRNRADKEGGGEKERVRKESRGEERGGR